MAGWGRKSIKGDSKSPEWQAENLTWIEPVPGQRWQVYKPAAPQFEGLLKDLIAAGYKPTSSGGYNYRNIRGGNQLSEHAYGTAIDMNAMTNAMGQKATDIPNAKELAEKWNLEWGGNWKGRPDPMHFEYRGDGQPVPPTRDDLAKAAANPITDYSISPAEANAATAERAAAAASNENPISGYGGGPQPAAPAPADGGLFAGVKSPIPEEGIFGLRGKDKDKKSWRDKLAEGFAGFGSAIGGGVPQMKSTPSSPTQMTQAPIVAPIDPNQSQGRRQALAQALAQLNTGKLFLG